jgi:hypothetical protein
MPVFETIFSVISGGLWGIKYIIERQIRKVFERWLVRMLLAWEMARNPEILALALALSQGRRGIGN